MERILSKEEISELLSAVREGALDVELEVEEADFSVRPRKVSSFSLVQSRTQSGIRLPNFDILLDSFARNLAFSISSRVQRTVTVVRDLMQEVEFGTLVEECMNYELFGVIGIEPLKKNALLIFDSNLAFSQIEIILGGSADLHTDPPKRSLTAIELNLSRDIFSDTCTELNKAFSPIEQLNSSLIHVETNPRLVNIVASDTDMMVATFKVKIEEIEGNLRLAIPYSSLDPVREKLKTELGMAGPTGQWRDYMAEQVAEMEVVVAAELARVKLNVREILDLRAGDIIELGCNPESTVQLLVEGQPKFSAFAGLRDNKKAVRIVDRLHRRE
ncbi:MAG: FliM/FliN family flagellar motor switch protein [Desulfuromonadaceae bacterium]|nr:FliM/FliN family flagellar motor switch protein [Desulfuromonadaceae bacterium]